ncbi:MAG: sugar ABC transporter permease [Thermobacillus sp. ZCTH02-B1]|uniref:carbohydrate ABC transporter permease n=1 Tax=Thermobacillus sp. ZCTH02-B1 TaxID=1858795 RepID=UPI000B54F876|nr:sugar ABC transporter permease [Thermobacillus sp. ZCTH02-B1]OUM95653.1 MAG: sugar ABC transporter permease [Thermobacillus sp. ZCTH02-B1]
MRPKSYVPYVFLMPNLLIFSVFIVFPALFGIVYSFHKYDGLNPMEFVGFRNYASLLQSREFWEVMRRTFVYVVTAVPLIFAGALLIAMMLVQEIRGRGLFRAVYYWPVMISFIIVGLTWKWILGDSFGVVNYLLERIGLEPVKWLSDPTYAKLSVILATLWSRIGFYMVIFIAGLQSIPQDYYEAARIDGANRIRTFFNITLPLLKPTSLLVLILSVIEAFKQYPLMMALTGGGPGKATTNIVQYIYQTGFIKMQLGMASAMSVVLFVIIAVFTVFQFRLTRGGAIE